MVVLLLLHDLEIEIGVGVLDGGATAAKASVVGLEQCCCACGRSYVSLAVGLTRSIACKAVKAVMKSVTVLFVLIVCGDGGGE